MLDPSVCGPLNNHAILLGAENVFDQCAAGSPTLVVFGNQMEVGIQDGELCRSVQDTKRYGYRQQHLEKLRC